MTDEDLHGALLPRTPAIMQAVTIAYRPRTVVMYALTEEEVRSLAQTDAQVSLGLFGLTFGAALACAITLLTVSLSDRAMAGFIAATATFSVLALWFGWR